MKFIKNIPFALLLLCSMFFVVSCDDDDSTDVVPDPIIEITAVAGPDQQVEPMDQVSIDGSASAVSGTTSATYAWSITNSPAGSMATLDDVNSRTPSFTADLEGTYDLELVITAGDKSESDQVSISAVNPVFDQADQMGRPAINTVFVAGDSKDAFNTTTPSDMGAMFAAAFQTRLLALNPDYTINALGWDAATFAGALATDVLNLDTEASTAFGTLNGRTLDDDVITTELTLIFGGATGLEKPGLTDDNVDANDKAFLNQFPYLAAPH